MWMVVLLHTENKHYHKIIPAIPATLETSGSERLEPEEVEQNRVWVDWQTDSAGHVRAVETVSSVPFSFSLSLSNHTSLHHLLKSTPRNMSSQMMVSDSDEVCHWESPVKTNEEPMEVVDFRTITKHQRSHQRSWVRRSVRTTRSCAADRSTRWQIVC